MKPIHWIMLVVWIGGCVGNLRAQSCCESDDQVKLCYVSSQDYCDPTDLKCQQYSLDGALMEDALRLKLLNTDNFGNNDLVPCFFELVKLPINPSLSFIKSAGCDIIFLPTVEPNKGSTFIPQRVFNSILDWSVECPKNLVIASQGETTKWGYDVTSPNTNPNFPELNSSLNRIFKRPFGAIQSFEQGGEYQGFFSGRINDSEIIAKDNNDRATILLDLETNDLMFADIGIFCTGGAGNITDGDLIVSNNDKLVCNTFALACQLASSTVFSYQVFEDCETPVTLPDGSLAYDIGFYTDTLMTDLGCDSIVDIEIIPCVIVPNIFTPNGDQRNKYFNPISESKIFIETFQVFNRWGQLVYDNQTPETGWDGTFNNQMAPADVYVYRIIYSNTIGSNRLVKTGDVTLLR